MATIHEDSTPSSAHINSHVSLTFTRFYTLNTKGFPIPHPINSNNNNVNNDGSGRPQPNLAQAIKLKQYVILGSFNRSRPGPAVFFGRSKVVRCESSLDANETLYDQPIWERTFWVHNSIQRTIINFNLIHELRVSPT